MIDRFKKITVILPCRDEEQSIGACLAEIKKTLVGLDFEIIVSDSSTDRSAAIAETSGAKVVRHNQIGYGRAYLTALPEAGGDYIILADADYTYDFADMFKLLDQLTAGADLVIGSRLAGQIDQKAMPILHRHIGIPGLNLFLKIFFGIQLSDSQSGFRAIKKEALANLALAAPGMEFASEMIIKAKKAGLKISQVPIHYRRRLGGKSKLKSFNDGWQHLRFMLLYSPDYLFFGPGILLLTGGLVLSTLFLFPPVQIGNFSFITHPMFMTSLMAIIGYELILLGIFAKTYAHYYLNEPSQFIANLNLYLNLEKTLIAGGLVFGFSGLIFGWQIINWWRSDFGEIANPNLSIYTLLLMILGLQTIFSAFMISILGIKNTGLNK